MSYAGKVALVTGAGQNRGIGEATAQLLAQRGATVIATDLKAPDIAAFQALGLVVGPLEHAASLGSASAGRVLTCAMDVTDASAVERVVGTVIDALGRIDILFNNAGVAVGAGPFMNATDEDWLITHNVNVLGLVRTTRAVYPHMARQGSGAIVNNASLVGLVGHAGYSVYCATKFAVVGITKCLADEFGPTGVRVNAVCPGYIDTQLNDQQVEFLSQQKKLPPEQIRQLQAETPALRRLGTPLDVAKAVAWLAGEDADYITGAALPVTGALKLGL